MWEWLVGYINMLRSRGWGYGDAFPSLLTFEQINFYKGAVAITVAVVLAVVLVAFVIAGIYSAGYIVYAGTYNLIYLMKNKRSKKQVPVYVSNKKGKRK